MEIIAAYFKGDSEALKALFGRYLKRIYNFVFQYVRDAADAEDITQEAFIKAWRCLERFDTRKSFKTWLFCIAKNSAVDFIRKKKTIPFSEFENDQEQNTLEATLADEDPLPDEILRRADIGEKVNGAVKKLSAAYRAVLYLYYYDGFNLREIAEILGESADTVKSRHRRALIMLKEELGGRNKAF